MRRLYPTLLLLLAAGCSRTSSPVVDSPVTGDAASRIASLPGADPIEAAACGGRGECRLVSEVRQADAVEAVVRLAPGSRAAEPSPFHQGVQPAPRLGGCTPWETWLLSSASGHAGRVQLLVSDCVPDLGANPVLADLGGGRLRYTHTGAGDRSQVYELGLGPPRVERQVEHTRGVELTWNDATHRGQACQGDWCVPLMPEAPVADEAFARGGWKSTSLGECSMLVDGAPTLPGDTSHGQWEPRVDGTASVRALFSGDTLYVEVTDDAFVTEGKLVDTLVFESHFSEAMPGARSWTARLRMDGTLTDWDGKVQQVEVGTGPSTRRFALKGVWPGPQDLWHLSYEDTDDGKTVAATLTTSRGAKPAFAFSSSRPCVPRDGALHVQEQAADPERPLVR